MSVATSSLPRPLQSRILKISLFATGLAGIVAEYVLSTLATYFLGDSVFQWTMIVSIMLFSMGLGSRLSQLFEKNLLQTFIFIEFALSVFSAFSALITYVASGYTVYTGLIIYSLSILIGILIGLEIPLVVRVNDEFQSLRINVASVMEKDYFGSLLGGVFFAFVGLPYLGLTYTPFLLGFINFSVAVVLVALLWGQMTRTQRRRVGGTVAGVAVLLLAGLVGAKPIILYGEQVRYKDKVIYDEQSRYQKITLTQWKDDHWLFINGNQQLSTVDEVMYHEPLVHPAMHLTPHPQSVLVLGGGDGCAVREVLKYPSVETVTVVDLDPAMTELAKTHPVLVTLNEGALTNERVTVVNQDAFTFVEQTTDYYDVMIIDLPDPKSADLSRLYTREFYQLCARHLRPQGVLITQAGSPYFATRAFQCINRTLQRAGFQTQPLHNQVVTMGEWGWILGVKNDSLPLKKALRKLSFDDVNTQWLNQEAMLLMTSFGKDYFLDTSDRVKINTLGDQVLYRYYLKGNWDLY